jgi:predicted DCC family thiol-disulfide oxidoreductase YuxK
MTGPQRILIYDGRCRLCVTAKSGIERLGETQDVRWVPYHSEEAARCLGKSYQPGRPDAAFLVEADGTITKGLDAFVTLLPGLRGGRLLLALWRVPFLRPIAYLLYRLLARHRYRLFGQTSARP